LDTTHKTTNTDNYLLYTIAVRHPAYCFTTDHSKAPVIKILEFVKNQGHHNVQRITIDVSYIELSAIQAVYPNAQVQWYLLHVARAWMNKIKELVKTGSSTQNGVKHRKIMTSLKEMMWEKNYVMFNERLRQFINDFTQHGINQISTYKLFS
jgi:hypothetical protein